MFPFLILRRKLGIPLMKQLLLIQVVCLCARSVNDPYIGFVRPQYWSRASTTSSTVDTVSFLENPKEIEGQTYRSPSVSHYVACLYCLGVVIRRTVKWYGQHTWFVAFLSSGCFEERLKYTRSKKLSGPVLLHILDTDIHYARVLLVTPDLHCYIGVERVFVDCKFFLFVFCV